MSSKKKENANVIVCSIVICVVLLVLCFYNPSTERFKYTPDQTQLVLGNTPMKLSTNPIPYIRLNSNDTLLVPNSMASLSHITDVDEILCGKEAIKDDDYKLAALNLQRKGVDGFRNIPLTALRKYQDNSRVNRTPMPPY